MCKGQPTPVVDNVTGKLFMAFNDRSQFPNGFPRMTVSTDDGLTFANHTAIPCLGSTACKGGSATSNVGLGRGFVIYNESLPTKTRLILPSETGTMYSDDHGAHWTIGPPPVHSTSIGENSIARCTPGACGGAPGGSARFAMVHRGPDPKDKTRSALGMHFSNDSIHWTASVPLPSISPYSNYSQAPGLLAVPGGLLLSRVGRGRPSDHKAESALLHGDGLG